MKERLCFSPPGFPARPPDFPVFPLTKRPECGIISAKSNDSGQAKPGKPIGGISLEPVEHSNNLPAQPAGQAEEGAAVYRPDGQETLDVAMEIGVAILRSGGDVHRVEDSMTRICRAYGAARVGVFAIPSLITAEVTMPDGETVSRMYRVESTYLHLARLEEINALSRSVCAVPEPPDRVREQLTAIRKLRRIPEWLCYVGGMLGAGGFTVFAGGTWRDGLCSALIGAMIVLGQRHRLVRENINPMGVTAVGSFVSGLLAVLCIVFGLGQNLDTIIIGTIMPEIPGLSFGDALRDLLCGDTVSGSLRNQVS